MSYVVSLTVTRTYLAAMSIVPGAMPGVTRTCATAVVVAVVARMHAAANAMAARAVVITVIGGGGTCVRCRAVMARSRARVCAHARTVACSRRCGVTGGCGMLAASVELFRRPLLMVAPLHRLDTQPCAPRAGAQYAHKAQCASILTGRRATRRLCSQWSDRTRSRRLIAAPLAGPSTHVQAGAARRAGPFAIAAFANGRLRGGRQGRWRGRRRDASARHARHSIHSATFDADRGRRALRDGAIAR